MTEPVLPIPHDHPDTTAFHDRRVSGGLFACGIPKVVQNGLCCNAMKRLLLCKQIDCSWHLVYLNCLQMMTTALRRS